MNKHVVIIGGGVGGLFTGALLARNGCRVTVLEKNRIAGGGLQCFQRRGELYETGMHILGGFQEGGCLNKICRYLGIMDSLDIRPTDDEAIDTITYWEEGPAVYNIPRGRERFIAYLSERFPEEAEGLRNYVATLYRIADEIDLFNLRCPKEGFVDHGEEFLMPADQLIARYISDSRLRDVLAYMNPMYGGVAGHTPAYVHAMINVLYIEGSSLFGGGGQHLADALIGVIRAGGGEVLTGDAVVHIETADRQVQKVVTRSGREYVGDVYVSDIHPTTLLRLVDENAFPRAYRMRLEEIPNTYSAFVLYLKFRPGTIPYVNHPCYYQERYGLVWQHAENFGDPDWPLGFMYLTPPDKNQGPYASRMTVNCLMSFDEVRRWTDTTIGNRGSDYEEWKEQTRQRVIAKLERLYPGISACVEDSFTASPLTIRDYYGSKEGTLYGYRQDCENMALSQLHIATKLRNLLLTGQNIYLHGICGVPLTAIVTAEAILGQGVLLEQINPTLN